MAFVLYRYLVCVPPRYKFYVDSTISREIRAYCEEWLWMVDMCIVYELLPTLYKTGESTWIGWWPFPLFSNLLESVSRNSLCELDFNVWVGFIYQWDAVVPIFAETMAKQLFIVESWHLPLKFYFIFFNRIQIWGGKIKVCKNLSKCFKNLLYFNISKLWLPTKNKLMLTIGIVEDIHATGEWVLSISESDSYIWAVFERLYFDVHLDIFVKV